MLEVVDATRQDVTHLIQEDSHSWIDYMQLAAMEPDIRIQWQ